MKKPSMTLMAVALAIGLGGSALANETTKADPYAKADDSWITISGTVERTSPKGFALNYGDGTVAVEMDTPAGATGGYKVRAGDKVTVTGAIDDDLFETTSIEASSVYVEPLKTHFFSSAVDEEDVALAVVSPIVIAKTAVVGTVTDVDGSEFTVNTGAQSVRVDASQVAGGADSIETGERVSVIGSIDRDFFEGRELMADAVVALSPLVASSEQD